MCRTVGPRLDPSMVNTTPNRIHPTRSSNIAEEITTVPISSPGSPMSMRVLAITGRADIESAVPTSEFAPGRNPRNLGKERATINPMTNGKITPRELTNRALLPRRKIRRKLVSRPATSRKKTTPSVVTVSSTIGNEPVVGKTQEYHCGWKCPRTVGPSRMPAKISPRISGYRIFRVNSPMNLAVPSRTESERNIVAISPGVS